MDWIWNCCALFECADFKVTRSHFAIDSIHEFTRNNAKETVIATEATNVR
jgi:hypothetical protein